MITVENLALRQGQFRLDEVNFSIPTGAYAVMVGRTGCGKTSILEAIAGLRAPSNGRIFIHGQDVTVVAPAARGIGYVPQDAAVFSAMTVRENLGFALSARGEKSKTIRARVDELADWLRLTTILERQAIGLSGGEAQRVALGRALAFRPTVLLLDEPLNALDEATHGELLELLATVRKSGSVTALHVSHIRAEAEKLADMVLELDGGRVMVRR